MVMARPTLKKKAKYVPKDTKLKEELGHWNYTGKDRKLAESFGFLYLMVNKQTGMAYVGKRQFWAFKRNSMTKTGAALWRLYKSSSSHVKAAIKGGEAFEYHILGVFETRAWLSYTEAYLQMVLQTMTERASDGERMWYNNQVAAIRFVPKESKIEHKEMESCLSKAYKILNKARG